MKTKLSRLSQRYVAALGKHLQPGARASLQPAVGLGRQAVALGLETLELARIHERALATLELSNSKNGPAKRAEIFFTEALTPIVETHRTARQSKIDLSRLNETLNRRTLELAATNRQLQRGIVRRKSVEAALKQSGERYTRLLKESLQLQEGLRQLTHQVLSAQEDERKKISANLQDEIAQTLLSINVRLLTLKTAARGSTANLTKEIASTQRLVAESAQSINRFALELDNPQPSVTRSVRHNALRRCGAELPASAEVAERIMKTKSKSERREKKPAHAARATTPESPTSDSFPVIAMAASVGGLKALSVILGGLPADFPAAIAIVMHLSPEHKSILAEILSSRTPLAVKQAQTGDILCHSSVFIAPPNHHLSVAKGGRLELSSSAAEKVNYARPSAEPLFASVAAVYQKSAIAVVLTGGDGDGSFGVQIIKDEGGKVIAQDRPTSENFSMPETSIKTGDVDFILPLDEIAPKLMELVSAGRGLKNGRISAKRTGPPQVSTKLVTPH